MNDERLVIIEETPATFVEVNETQIVVAGDESISVVEVGLQGPAGPPGHDGDKSFVQAFTSATILTVTHNLGKYPAITVVNSAHDAVEADVAYVDINSLTVSFAGAMSGSVYCN